MSAALDAIRRLRAVSKSIVVPPCDREAVLLIKSLPALLDLAEAAAECAESKHTVQTWVPIPVDPWPINDWVAMEPEKWDRVEAVLARLAEGKP